MTKSAIFSEDKKHRYLITRIWNESKPLCCFNLLNPSDADDKINDPTTKRCIDFAANWGYGGFYGINMYSYITPYPDKIIKDDFHRIENRNKRNSVISYLNRYNLDLDTNLWKTFLIFAWGSYKVEKSLIDDLFFDLKSIGDIYPHCIKQNKNGSPTHPLYLKSDLKPIPYKAMELEEKNDNS